MGPKLLERGGIRLQTITDPEQSVLPGLATLASGGLASITMFRVFSFFSMGSSIVGFGLTQIFGASDRDTFVGTITNMAPAAFGLGMALVGAPLGAVLVGSALVTVIFDLVQVSYDFGSVFA